MEDLRPVRPFENGLEKGVVPHPLSYKSTSPGSSDSISEWPITSPIDIDFPSSILPDFCPTKQCAEEKLP